MRESIGSVSLLNFVIFFILLVFAFLIGTFSYYKAYRVNNSIISIIEKYEGFNELAYKEIDERLGTLAYERYDFDCDRGKTERYHLISYKSNKEVTNAEKSKDYEGFCIFAKTWDSNGTLNSKDRYDSYMVTTVIRFNFPIVQDLIKLRVSSRTDRIYNYECAQNSNCSPEYSKCTNPSSNGVDCMD